MKGKETRLGREWRWREEVERVVRGIGRGGGEEGTEGEVLLD